MLWGMSALILTRTTGNDDLDTRGVELIRLGEETDFTTMNLELK